MAREHHVLLFAQNEEDTALREIVQEGEVHIGTVGQHHVAVLEPRAQRVRSLRVVVRSILHDGEGRQAVADVEAHVRLRGGFLAPVPGPVDAVERELQRRGVDGEDVALDPVDIRSFLWDANDVG